ncbi:MAG: hypothetical protein H6R16_2977 [Proteobacteria bacterium]|nr:hypothetical protein [Pseudomonadota bacterium]
MQENLKHDLDKILADAVGRKELPTKTIRKLFSYRFSPILLRDTDAGFDIIDRISTHFSIPFRSVHICGSAQTGYSYFKNKEFSEQGSDLDIAIVEPRLFQRYCEISFEATLGYTDLTKFLTRDGVNTANEFRDYLVRGYFRPDLMPSCGSKQQWFSFFNRLSNDYPNHFKSINGGLYLSEVFFERKQLPLIQKYKEFL